VDECKPLAHGREETKEEEERGHGAAVQAGGEEGRGLHSSTFQLKVSTFCGILGIYGGIQEVCLGVLRGMRGWGVFRLYFVSEPAQVELKSGRLEAPGRRSRRGRRGVGTGTACPRAIRRSRRWRRPW